MDIIRNLYLHKYSHKMFYKTKSSSGRSENSAATVTTPSSQNNNNNNNNNNNSDGLRSQQFYLYSIDSRTPGANIPPPYLDLPPKYEDVVKDQAYARRDVV